VAKFNRSENPPPFDDYQEYRPFLRRDFRRRCAYCERNEFTLGGEEFFEIDHFRPVDRFPEQIANYPNLYYTCGKCNRHKARTWPSVDAMSRGFRFADPCEEDMYIEHLEEIQGGELRPKTNIGAYTRDHIRLNRPDLIMWRQTRMQIAAELRAFEDIAVRIRGLMDMASVGAEREKMQEEVGVLEASIARLRQQYY
jgi:hypothetical protein